MLHYRGLIHGIQCPRYWDMGGDDRDFKWNNYISRYRTRHLDLMDLLAGHTEHANAPLDELAQTDRLPRQTWRLAARVWGGVPAGRLNRDHNLLRDRCRVNTWLVFARFRLECATRFTPRALRATTDWCAARSPDPTERTGEFLAQWPAS